MRVDCVRRTIEQGRVQFYGGDGQFISELVQRDPC
jgi:hypothetical protein